MQPFEAYKLFLAIKNHFTKDSYDYFKYNGKVTASFNSFLARKDKYYFSKLTKKDDLLNFLVSNFLEKEKIGWVGDLMHEDADENYKKWLGRQQNLSYLVKEDLGKIDDLKETLKVLDGQHPKLLKMLMQKELMPETLLIIDFFTNVFDVWDKKIQDTIVWPTFRMRLLKYKPFFKFDKDNMKKILLETVR